MMILLQSKGEIGLQKEKYLIGLNLLITMTTTTIQYGKIGKKEENNQKDGNKKELNLDITISMMTIPYNTKERKEENDQKGMDKGRHHMIVPMMKAMKEEEFP